MPQFLHRSRGCVSVLKNVFLEFSFYHLTTHSWVVKKPKKLSQIIKGKLHYRELIPIIIVGGITSVLIQEFANLIVKPTVEHIKKGAGIKKKKNPKRKTSRKRKRK